MQEIWQTTNQQPWVYALTEGLITCKTRTSAPCVPVGVMVFLHASKARLWPGWKNLPWAAKLSADTFERGKIVATAIVQEVGLTEDILRRDEYKFWDVKEREWQWNCAGVYAVRFRDILPLSKPVECRGFQAPFARAKKEVIQKVLCLNPAVRDYLPATHEAVAT